MDVFSHNGVIKPKEQATVNLFNIEVTYGFGVYESIRVVKGVAKYHDMHAERLMKSADIIGLEHELTVEKVSEYINALVAELATDACNLKLLLIGGRTSADAEFYILPLAPYFPDRKLYKTGAHAITVEYERYIPDAKTLNMLPSYLAYRQASKAGAYDAILVDHKGNMLEGTRTNLFAIKGKTLYTAPVNEVLEGVTRIRVIQCAKDNGYGVTEADLSAGDLDQYDSYFLTSTSTKIMPLKSINDQQLEISEELKTLIELFKQSD
jgi:branched-chain amino acid aminotransferase